MFLSKLFKKNSEAKKHVQNNKGDENVSKMLWVVIVFVVGSILLTIVSGAFTTKTANWYNDTIDSWFNDANGMYGDVTIENGGTNIDTLTFTYYSTLAGAIADVNADTIGVNADVEKSGAVAGISTTDEGEVVVALFDNASVDAAVTLEKDMTLNLNGKVLSSSASGCIKGSSTGGNTVIIDGRKSGSQVSVNGTNTAIAIQTNKTNFVIEGGVYAATGGGATAAVYVGAGTTTVNRATLTGTSTSSMVATAYGAGGTFELYDCTISGVSDTGSTCAIFAGNGSPVSATSCTITATNNSGVINVISNSGGQITIANSTISGASTNGAVYGLDNQKGYANITNSEISIVSVNNHAFGVNNTESTTGVIELTSCDINVDTQAEIGFGVRSYSEMTLIDCNIFVDVSYSADSSIGVLNKGIATINNCDVYATGYSIENMGEGAKLYVNGGTYESCMHGGAYFSHGATGDAYVTNATLANVAYKGKYEDTREFFSDAQKHYAGFYVGGTSESAGSNMNVYIDNCNIIAGSSAFTLRGSAGEQSNAVYISNSTININHIRIDNNTHKLYIGVGCNFTDTAASKPECVTTTNETYAR